MRANPKVSVCCSLYRFGLSADDDSMNMKGLCMTFDNEVTIFICVHHPDCHQ